ncbi:MAG: MBL fold metallo-hydrolase [Ktedonobacteraceae bacterium]|nr:MBL fold metallo-hydrolase [Ktedonobacteraceae bacterium]
MKKRQWAKLSGLSLAAFGAVMVIKSFLPRRLAGSKPRLVVRDGLSREQLPEIRVTFLRCGHATLPEALAVRGSFSLAPLVLAHSAVLIEHPRAIFLYDTGLCSDIFSFLKGEPLFFRRTLASFVLDQPLAAHLQRLGVNRLDFALLSHLHWDHVSGVPDIAGVPLRINKVEYDAARLGRFDQWHALVPRLLGSSPLELFSCDGPPYEGFASSHDLFGDGSIVLVPLPGHTAGNTGMFINRANGGRLLLLGDAVWVADNYLRPATMHPFFWSLVTGDSATACQTLIDLHYFAASHPEVSLIAMHDARMQETFMRVEASLAQRWV